MAKRNCLDQLNQGEVGRPTLNVGGTILWARDLDCIKKRKQLNMSIHHPSLLPGMHTL